MTRSKVIWKNVFILAAAGGVAFWVTSYAISRTPIAAEYRAALSISYLPMLVQALVGGLIIAGCVSFFLLRFFDMIPNKGSDFKIRNTKLRRPDHYHNLDRRSLKFFCDK